LDPLEPYHFQVPVRLLLFSISFLSLSAGGGGRKAAAAAGASSPGGAATSFPARARGGGGGGGWELSGAARWSGAKRTRRTAAFSE